MDSALSKGPHLNLTKAAIRVATLLTNQHSAFGYRLSHTGLFNSPWFRHLHLHNQQIKITDSPRPSFFRSNLQVSPIALQMATEDPIVAIEPASGPVPEPADVKPADEKPATKASKAKAAKEAKAKKPAAPRKPRSPPSHPPYEEVLILRYSCDVCIIEF